MLTRFLQACLLHHSPATYHMWMPVCLLVSKDGSNSNTSEGSHHTPVNLAKLRIWFTGCACLFMAVGGTYCKSVLVLSPRRGMLNCKTDLEKSLSVTGWLSSASTRIMGQIWRRQNAISWLLWLKCQALPSSTNVQDCKNPEDTLLYGDLGGMSQHMTFLRILEFFSSLSLMEPKLGANSMLHVFKKCRAPIKLN